MRHLILSLVICLACATAAAQDLATSNASSWSDFVVKTIKTLKAESNRLVSREDLTIFSTYTQRSFDLDAEKEGYYIAILYLSKFCKAPSVYFNCGDGHDISNFKKIDDGTFACLLLKVPAKPGKRGHIYFKNNEAPDETRTMTLLIIEH